MISIYQQPTKKNPTLGLTFKVFSEEKFCIQHEKYSSYESAMGNLQLCKVDVLLMNLESFWLFCDTVTPNATQEIVDSVTAIRNVVNNGLDHKDKFKLLLTNVIENTNFIRALVKAVPLENKVATVMMAATIIGFCKEELDGIKEDKS